MTETHSARVIVLKRRNYLRKVISSSVAKQQNRYRLRASEKPVLVRIKLDVNAVAIDGDVQPLLSRFEGWDHNFRQLDKLLDGQQVLRLTYEEDILDAPAVAYRKVCSFLDMPVAEPKVSYGRNNPFAVSDIVLNFDEIVKTLSGTAFEWMLSQ